MNPAIPSATADDSDDSNNSKLTTPNVLATEIDLRANLQPIRDQEERPTCLVFATTACHEWARTQTESVVEDLSEEIFYWGSKQIDGDLEPGTSFYSAAEALQQWGQPAETVWPYDGLRIDTDSSYQPPAGALEPNICYKTTIVEIEPSISRIKEYLAQQRVVAIGIPIWASFLMPTDGYVPMPSTTDTELGGHAVSIVGYWDGSVSTTSNISAPGLASAGYFIFRNSWGEEWGEGGYGYLPYEYVSNYQTEVWVI